MHPQITFQTLQKKMNVKIYELRKSNKINKKLKTKCSETHL